MTIVIGIILILASIFLVAAVLMQQGKSRNLSGAIGGGTADTFFGKSKNDTKDKKLSRLTTIVAIVFVVLVLIMYLMQDTPDYSGYIEDTTAASDTTAAVEGDASVDGAGADVADTTAAESGADA